MNGGSTSTKSRKQEIMKLLLNSDNNILANIAIYYFYNNKEDGNPKILNGDDIINIMISFIYNEFIDSELETSEIIDPEYIKTIQKCINLILPIKLKVILKKMYLIMKSK
jgi:hypothetical protein